MATPTDQQAPAPIRGSWEELLGRAQELAASRDDEAIEIYEKLITRLLKMTPEQRAVQENRLQGVLIQSGVNLQAYYNILERFDDASDVLVRLSTVVEEEELPSLDSHRAQILVMAEKFDEAIALMREITEREDAEIPELSAIARLHIDRGELDKAAEVIEEIAQRAAEDAESDETNENDQARDQGFVENLRSLLALEQGNSEAAIDHFEKAMAVFPFYADNTHLLYIRLMHSGLYEEALPFIKKETKRKIQPAFWRGLALHHLGETKEAEQLWKKATEIELDESESAAFLELILSFYYLGDKERLGLELLLRLINESRNPGWSVFFLLGLGWSIHDNAANAITNFDMGLQQMRTEASGTKFPKEVKTFVRDLLSEEQQIELAKYFE